jgi:hypothetical protein
MLKRFLSFTSNLWKNTKVDCESPNDEEEQPKQFGDYDEANFKVLNKKKSKEVKEV